MAYEIPYVLRASSAISKFHPLHSQAIWHGQANLPWKAENTNFGMALFHLLLLAIVEYKTNKTGVINDPLGQTHSLAISEHCFHFVLLC